MAATAIDSLRGILNGFRDLNSKGIYTMNATETDLLRQILLEVQALSLGGLADGSVTTSKIADLNVTEAKLADLNVTTSKIADLNVTEAKLALAFKQSLFNQNLFKNPNFAVIQGTASGTLANSTALPTASLGYLGETEWCVAASGGTPAYAFSAVDECVTFTGAASTSAIYLLQRLQSRDTNRLKNKTVTFSCEISNSLLTSVIWEVFRPTTSDDVHGTIATPTQTLIASGTFTVSSTLTRYSATFALPDLASRGLEVRLRVGAQTSGTWVVSRLQLEEGSVATDFNCGDFDEELFKCRRYFLAVTTWVGAAATYATTYSFPNRMFATPILVGGGAGYVSILNFDGVVHSQAIPASQAFTFSAHIP
jgi:hypothetical protein